MRFHMTLMTVATATFATLAGSALAGPDTAHGAGRARAPLSNAAVVPQLAQGACAAAGVALAPPARPAARPPEAGAMKHARGAGRARPPSTNAAILVASATCGQSADNALRDRTGPPSASVPGSKGARGAGRARAPAGTQALAALRG